MEFFSITNSAPPMYNIYNRTVVWTVTDVNGNSKTCSQIAYVLDNQLPTIACPTEITLLSYQCKCVEQQVQVKTLIQFF